MAQLVAHLVTSRRGLLDRLAIPDPGPPLSLSQYVSRYPASAESRSGSAPGPPARWDSAELINSLGGPATGGGSDGPSALTRALGGRAGSAVISGLCGPVTARDWVRSHLLELVVHTDDLSRSLADLPPAPITRAALAAATRLLAEILAAQAPGRTVELRVAPFIAVQAVPGPRHTRGTPPNVIETDPLTWLRLATGRLDWAQAVATHRVRASGTRADLTAYLPVLRCPAAGPG